MASDWKNHDGSAPAPGEHYPVPPPPEVGEVVSAWSALARPGELKVPGALRSKELQYAGLGALLGLLVPGLIAGTIAFALAGTVWALVAMALLFGAGTFMGARPLVRRFLGKNVAVCSYVGRAGICRVTGLHEPQLAVLRFDEMAAPQVTEHEVRAAGTPVVTSVDFVFARAAGGAPLRVLAVKPKPGQPAGDDYLFGAAAVRAWEARAR